MPCYITAESPIGKHRSGRGRHAHVPYSLVLIGIMPYSLSSFAWSANSYENEKVEQKTWQTTARRHQKRQGKTGKPQENHRPLRKQQGGTKTKRPATRTCEGRHRETEGLEKHTAKIGKRQNTKRAERKTYTKRTKGNPKTHCLSKAAPSPTAP